MKGIISFHPVDLAFFDGLIAPLLAGRKVDPDPFIHAAAAERRNAWEARRHASALGTLLEVAGPAKPEPGAGVLKNLRTRLEALDYRPDEATRIITKTIEPDIHLQGRPYFVAEVSAGRVAEAVEAYRVAPSAEAVARIAREQMARLDPKLPGLVEPEDGPVLSNDLNYRSDLLAELTQIFELARAAREGAVWGRGSETGRPAIEVVREEIPWRALALHARARPFWIARDLDGMETVCRGTGVPAPEELVPARRLFAEAIDAFDGLGGALHMELERPRDIGVFVAPADVEHFLDWLNAQGGRIIAAAARAGEGPAAATLLRKVKECATYAAARGLGYLEASGIVAADLVEQESAAAVR